MTTSDRIREIVEPVLADLGLCLYDIDCGSSLVRITVEVEGRAPGVPDGGVGFDLLGAATRGISRALDEADPIPGRYTLEVSSPGLERPLRTPAHFSGSIGSEVSVKTVAGYEGERRLAGVLVDADDEGIRVRPEGGEPVRLRYDEIDKARTTFTWGAAPRKKARAS